MNGCLLAAYSHGRGARERSLASFIRPLIPFMRALRNHFPKAPPPLPSLWGQDSIYEYEGDVNIQSTAPSDI